MTVEKVFSFLAGMCCGGAIIGIYAMQQYDNLYQRAMTAVDFYRRHIGSIDSILKSETAGHDSASGREVP